MNINYVYITQQQLNGDNQTSNCAIDVNIRGQYKWQMPHKSLPVITAVTNLFIVTVIKSPFLIHNPTNETHSTVFIHGKSFINPNSDNSRCPLSTPQNRQSIYSNR